MVIKYGRDINPSTGAVKMSKTVEGKTVKLEHTKF
jgi:hypothetical protein